MIKIPLTLVCKKLYLLPIPDSLSDQSHSAATETALLENRVDELCEHMWMTLYNIQACISHEYGWFVHVRSTIIP